jgi:hypothetical protein
MKIAVGDLRRVIRNVIREQMWVPGRYDPTSVEPVDDDEQERLNQPAGRKTNIDEDNLDEVDTDPSNNPGRPEDPYAYIGMRPEPTWALAHPGASGGSVAINTGVDDSEDVV